MFLNCAPPPYLPPSIPPSLSLRKAWWIPHSHASLGDRKLGRIRASILEHKRPKDNLNALNGFLMKAYVSNRQNVSMSVSSDPHEVSNTDASMEKSPSNRRPTAAMLNVSGGAAARLSFRKLESSPPFHFTIFVFVSPFERG